MTDNIRQVTRKIGPPYAGQDRRWDARPCRQPDLVGPRQRQLVRLLPRAEQRIQHRTVSIVVMGLFRHRVLLSCVTGIQTNLPGDAFSGLSDLVTHSSRGARQDLRDLDTV